MKFIKDEFAWILLLLSCVALCLSIWICKQQQDLIESLEDCIDSLIPDSTNVVRSSEWNAQ